MNTQMPPTGRVLQYPELPAVLVPAMLSALVVAHIY